MAEIDENVKYVTFKDVFIKGVGEARRIRLKEASYGMMGETIRTMKMVVEAAADPIKRPSQEEIDIGREETKTDTVNSLETKEKMLATFSMLEDITNAVDFDASRLINYQRVIDISNKLLSIPKEMIMTISDRALDIEKMKQWRDVAKVDPSFVPLDQKVSPETVQIALNEVEDAFDTVLQKARDKRGYKESEVASLFPSGPSKVEEVAPKAAEIEQHSMPVQPTVSTEEDDFVKSFPYEDLSSLVELTVNDRLNDLGEEDRVEEPSKEAVVAHSDQDDTILSLGDLPEELRSELEKDADVKRMLEKKAESDRIANELRAQKVALREKRQALEAGKTEEERKEQRTKEELAKAQQEKEQTIRRIKEQFVNAMQSENQTVEREITKIRDENQALAEENAAIQRETDQIKSRTEENVVEMRKIKEVTANLQAHFEKVTLNQTIQRQAPQGVMQAAEPSISIRR